MGVRFWGRSKWTEKGKVCLVGKGSPKGKSKKNTDSGLHIRIAPAPAEQEKGKDVGGKVFAGNVLKGGWARASQIFQRRTGG